MKILFLIDSLHSIAAGSERQIYKLIDGLSQSGNQVKLVILRATEFTNQLTSFPCEWEILNIGSIASLDAMQKMLGLRRRIKQENFDVIHAYFPDACILGPLFLKSTKNRLFTSRRDMGLIYLGKPSWIYRCLAVRTDAVISNSQAVSEYTGEKEGLAQAKRVVIYNGIEPYNSPDEITLELFKDKHATKLILVANIKPVKRTLDAVQAVCELITEGYNLELALVGEHQDPIYISAIKQVIEEARHEDKVTMTGSISEPRRLLSQADIGLLISESEGLSNTIMEYMYAGLPVIATNVGGNPELIRHDHTGILIEKGDLIQLKLAIIRLHSEASQRQTLGHAGRNLIEQQFSIKSLINKHHSIYTNKSMTTP